MKLLVLANNKTIFYKRIKPVPAFSLTNFTRSILRKLFFIVTIIGSITMNAQTGIDAQAAYKKTIHDRSAKIVNTLGITDSGKFSKVLDIIATQYISLNNIQEQDQSAIAAINLQSLKAEDLAVELKKQSEKKSLHLKQLHDVFVAQLKDKLSDEQVEKVKDGMTYRVVPITYAAYLDMLPTLTSDQKVKIYAWLVEARELAMDAGSSDKKHEVFGKYKGKINNYLSAAGFDMNKEGKEWQKRIKEREEKKKNSQ